MKTQFDIIDFADLMAQQDTYEDAWTVGLEIQAFGNYEAFHYVLKNGKPAARRAAAFWLADEAQKVPAHIFLSIYADSDEDIRFHAAYGLGYVTHPRAVPTLRDMLLHDPATEVRQTAAHSLFPAAKLNDQVDLIITDFEKALTKERSPAVREEIVTSLSYFLGTSAEPQAASILENMLSDEVPYVAEQARISLSVLNNEDWAHPVG